MSEWAIHVEHSQVTRDEHDMYKLTSMYIANKLELDTASSHTAMDINMMLHTAEYWCFSEEVIALRWKLWHTERSYSIHLEEAI